MNTPRLTWGDFVRVKHDAPAEFGPGKLGDVVAITQVDTETKAALYGLPAGSTVYQIEFGTGEAVEFSFRTDFFDDRLSIQLGGNVEFGEDGVLAYNGAFFGTDLAFEYAITPSRDLKVRLYQRREPDLGVGQRWEIGTGLTWRKEFNTFEEFWRAIKGK